MYDVQPTGALARTRAAAGGGLRRRVGSTVLLLGICSMLTDISSEMVTAILPLYLVGTLGFSPLQFGLIDGLYQGAGALVRLGGGFAGDAMRRHKPVAVAGYAISTVSKLALAVVGSGLGALSAVVFADRAGKGIRTAPRDAMISMSVEPRDLGLAFGVHRALDTAGAMLGPVIAFALLAAAPGAFQSLFVVAFFFGLLGLGVLTLLVREPRVARSEAEPAIRLSGAMRLFRERGFRRLTLVGCALGLATASDGFVYLLLLERFSFDLTIFPLLATGTALVFMVLAAPFGRLADRVGRARVMVSGYVLLLCVYLLLLTPAVGGASVAIVLVLLGAYYASTDGVLMALGSREVPERLRGSGLALLGTATSSARLVSSLAFGAIWTAASAASALAVFAAALTVAIAASAVVLRGAAVD